MHGGGCRPDAVTYSVLVAAYERGGQWRRALQAWEAMQGQGFRPDACVYSCVLESLWGSGFLPAQLRAAQVAASGHRQGHLRTAAGGPGECSATANTYGAAVLAAMRWLRDMG